METGLISATRRQKLGIQIEIIKELVGYICETVTDEHSAELVHLTRESVGSTDDSNIGPDQIDLSDYNSVLLKSNIDGKPLFRSLLHWAYFSCPNLFELTATTLFYKELDC